MGFATHLGPWLLGTVKHTTGTAVGSLRNIGTTICSQTKKDTYAGTTVASPKATTIAVLPAGAQIIDIVVDTLIAFTTSSAANLTVGDGSTANKYWTTTDILAAGRAADTGKVIAEFAGATSTASPDGIGIGPADKKIVATLSPATSTVGVGTVQYTVIYAVHEADGSSNPTTYTGP
jgi:hypothetical protein